jgi:hypothetical protein
LENICNGRVDCPHRDDEDRDLCKNWPRIENKAKIGEKLTAGADEGEVSSDSQASFDGQGFMFHVDNLLIYNSDVKMFDQNSDNVKAGVK